MVAVMQYATYLKVGNTMLTVSSIVSYVSKSVTEIYKCAQWMTSLLGLVFAQSKNSVQRRKLQSFGFSRKLGLAE